MNNNITAMTPAELIARYNIVLVPDGRIKINNISLIQRDNAVEAVSARKAEIVACIKAEADAQRKASEERAAKIAAIEGLREINAAISARIAYRKAFTRMMDDEYNDGANPPRQPDTDVDALLAAYPRAAAYVKAENWSLASNYVKSAAGKKALERIINGEDHDAVIRAMETEWSEYTSHAID